MELLQSCTKPSIYFFLLFLDLLFYFFSTWSWKIIPYLRFYFFSTWSWKIIPYSWYFDGLVQDCSNSSELAMELLQCCTKPSIYFFYFFSAYFFYFFSTWSWKIIPYFDGLVQDCSNSSELAMELLQSCTKPSIYSFYFFSTWSWMIITYVP